MVWFSVHTAWGFVVGLTPSPRIGTALVTRVTTPSFLAVRSPPPQPAGRARDVLEAVLCMMGVFDTTWVRMRQFLGQRGDRPPPVRGTQGGPASRVALVVAFGEFT